MKTIFTQMATLVGFLLCAAFTANAQGTGTTVNGPGNSLSFDGIDDFVKITMSKFPTYQNQSSSEFWFKSSMSQFGMMLRNIGGLRDGALINKYKKGNVLGFIDGTSNNGDGDYGDNLNDGQWHHMAVVYKDGLVNVYVDGILIGTKQESLAFSNNDTSHYFGTNRYKWRQYKGILDEVRYWEVALSEDQVRKNMHHRMDPSNSQTIPSGSEMTAYYNFNGSGNMVYDSTSFANNGKLLHGTSRISSTTPFGEGTTTLKDVQSSGIQQFLNSDLDIDFTVDTAGKMSATMLNYMPLGTQISAQGVFEKYWIVREYSSKLKFKAMDFYVDPGLLRTADSLFPETFKLYNRPAGSDQGWTLVDSAFAVDHNTGKITFKNISQRGQFAISGQGLATGISEKTELANLTVYPNPSSGVFNLISPNLSQNTNYTVHNMSGQVLETGIIRKNQQQLNIENQPNGVYLLTIQNEDGIIRRKLIKR